MRYTYFMSYKTAIEQEKVSVPKLEYLRLKTLDKRFGNVLEYLENTRNIQNARHEVKKRRVISQEKLFKNLGF